MQEFFPLHSCKQASIVIFLILKDSVSSVETNHKGNIVSKFKKHTYKVFFLKYKVLLYIKQVTVLVSKSLFSYLEYKGYIYGHHGML